MEKPAFLPENFFEKSVDKSEFGGIISLVTRRYGEVSEWFKELVLKTSDSQEPWVRIPPSPPYLYSTAVYDRIFS